MVSARELTGRRIVGFKPNAHKDDAGNTYHTPEIILDDGSILTFCTEEIHNGGDYGTFTTRHRAKP